MSQAITVTLTAAELRFLDAVAPEDAPAGRARQIALRRLILDARRAAGEHVDPTSVESLRARVERSYEQIQALLAAGSTLSDVARAMGVAADKHNTFRTYFSVVRRARRQQGRALARLLEAKRFLDAERDQNGDARTA